MGWDSFSGETVTIRALSEFLKVIEGLCDKWGTEDSYFGPWFRGHADCSYSLVPGLYRGVSADVARKDEAILRREFRVRALPYVDAAVGRPETDAEWYFAMQHYGAPTRLLDWTESAIIALYFAVRDPLPASTTHASVLVLNHRGMNEALVGKNALLRHDSDEFAKYFDHPTPVEPAAVVPGSTTRRMAAQRGKFTIHGSDSRGLEEYASSGEYLVRVRIPEESVGLLREQVDVAGIRETSVYPDLDGLVRELNREIGRA